MVVTSGQIIASAITNNSSSLFLQSGSNLYVQNNGLVEITGSLNATSITGSIAATNGVISGSTQLTSSYDGRYIQTGSFNSYTSSFSSSLASSITSVSGTFDNIIVNGQPTTYGVANLTTGVVAIQATATGTMNATVGKVTLSNSYSQVVGASSPGTTIFTLPTLQPGTYLITAQAKVNGGYSAMGIFTGGSQVANTSVFNWYQVSGTVNNGLQGTWVLTVTTPTVYTINAWGGGTVSAGSDGTAVANYIQINPTFALTALDTMQISGSLTTTGSITSLGGITGSIAATNGVISGSSQLTSSFDTRYLNTGGDGVISGSAQLPSGLISGSTQLTTAFPSKTTGAWSVPAGASTQSFTVEAGASYTMWVNGNIPNGIITWNATVTTSNTNVPVVGSQYGWYYTAGNALVLTAMPDQIIGTTNTLISSPTSYAPNTSNVFKFGITNNSGTTQTINYGYIKLS
jgi:hypothetical protein